MASYPSSLWSPTTKTNKVDLVDASHINDAQNEIVALETELGTDVAGDQTNLKTRLAYCIEDNGSFKHGTSFPGSPRAGDWFFRTDLNVAYVYTGSTWLAQSGITSYAAGDYKIYGPSDFIGLQTTTYTKVAEIYLPRGGTLRTIFGMASDNGSLQRYGRIYRNGSAVGTEQNAHSDDNVYHEYTEDIAGWSAGDLLQLYGKGANASWVNMIGGLRLYESTPSTEIGNGSYGLGKETKQTIWRTNRNVSPVGYVNALGNVGDLYILESGGASTTLYVKTGATTWTAK